jgi:hypothetical protein
MSQIAKTGTSTVDIDELRKNTKTFSSMSFAKLGTCMPPSQEIGTVLGVSRYVAAYGLKGGNLRVVLTQGAATAMISGLPSTIIDVAVAPESFLSGQTLVATLSAEGVCKLWEISNQDAGGEVDTRDMLMLKTRGEGAQRVFFHPGWVVAGGRNNIVFVLHEGVVTGVAFSREVREENAVDPATGLFLDKHACIRLTRDSKVLDMAFQQVSSSQWRCATAHENGQACVWALSSALLRGMDDGGPDDGSTASAESSSIASGATKRASKSGLLDAPPLQVFQVSPSPVLTVGFTASSGLVCGSDHNREFSLWGLSGDKSSKSAGASGGVIQRVALTRASNPIKGFRSTFVKRSVDGVTCVVLFESRTQDAVILPLHAEKRGAQCLFGTPMLFRTQHPVLSLSAEYDIEKDKLVCHVVDVDCIQDLEVGAEVAFGSVAPQDIRQSIRRASKRAESLIVSPDTAPVEWSDKPKCCVIA